MLRELYIAKEARYDSAFSNVHEEKLKRQETEGMEDDSPITDEPNV